MSGDFLFEVGDFVWYEKPSILHTEFERWFGRITQGCPTDVDFEVTFLNGEKKWIKSWFLMHATNEESMLAKLEN